MLTVSFPGGAGGNWLHNTLLQNTYDPGSVNFHKHGKDLPLNKDNNILIVHEIDPSKFKYLLSGKSYFNFYLNVIYKFFHHDLDIFNQTDYKNYFLECVNTARFLCKFDHIHKHIFFNFDDLINAPDNFYTQISKFQIDNNYQLIPNEEFLIRRAVFIRTCVNPSTINFNFDNMFWVCFVLGQLMNIDLVPTEFSICEYQNQDKCKQFALDNYKYCTLTNVHNIDTDVFMPNLL